MKSHCVLEAVIGFWFSEFDSGVSISRIHGEWCIFVPSYGEL
jgi:hypothetical protein